MILEKKLQEFILSPILPRKQEIASLARDFLRSRHEPTDICHTLIAMKVLEDLYRDTRRGNERNL